mgnify:CR=1 FL=1
MEVNKLKQHRRTRRRRNIRKRVVGTPERPRLSVYRSLKHMYAQVIDDISGTTIAAASTRDTKATPGSTGNVDSAHAVGVTLAERAKQAGIETCVFDRGGFRYHGRVRALADAAREGGLKF